MKKRLKKWKKRTETATVRFAVLYTLRKRKEKDIESGTVRYVMGRSITPTSG